MKYQKTARTKTKPQTQYIQKVARKEAKKTIKKDIETKIWEGSCTTNVSYDGINIPLHYDYGFTNVFPVQVDQLTRGTDNDNFIGDKIIPVYVVIRYSVVYADAFNKCAIALFQGKGSFLPTEADAASQWTGYHTGFAPLSFVPKEFDDRLTLLARRLHVMDSSDIPVVTGEIKIKAKKLRRMIFTGSNVESGELFLSVITDSSASSHPGIEVIYRIYYKDA